MKSKTLSIIAIIILVTTINSSTAKFLTSRSISDSFDANSGEFCDDENNCKGNGNNNQQQRNEATQNLRKTANIALKAAQEAKAAEEAQELAGKEASKRAKFQLAEKAIQAAKAAQAALSAKKLILEELERELREAEMHCEHINKLKDCSKCFQN
ncbi:hypothetical protein PVAND_005331 [Polypedilum vanderplanki]|uniref:Uncharacterized protein n=1 Tax=Polypedilum vanderplanki TaxID=319348 RepID=A0A9J6C092_POLVA|nr:hypothetical protein PVAND_005331 [Polypedilum vanderplanki]